jgi:release factor glutamine methyltransferase
VRVRIDAALQCAAGELEDVSESPRLDAETLLARALDVARSYLYAHPEDELDGAAIERYFRSIERRARGVPLAYITGTKEFWSLELMVSPETLIPRPETELLVELALRYLPSTGDSSALDLGTGSGAIALAIASERPNCRVIAVDTSRGALAVARENARQLELANVEFRLGHWTEPVAGMSFEVVAVNPPYVATGDCALQALKHEPAGALAAGEDGLDAVRLLARDCRRIVAPQGILVLEHGADQEQAVADLLQAAGWTGVQSYRDLAGLPRAALARPDGDAAGA